VALLDLEVSRGVRIPASELRQSASRSSGPGGQHVNKSATRVTLRWNVRRSAVLGDGQRGRLLAGLAPRLSRAGELIVHSEASRSRARNLDAARARLADLVAEALEVPRPRRPTRPSAAARARQREARRQRSSLKRSRRVRGDPDDPG
jgi:ribosome-associated protein